MKAKLYFLWALLLASASSYAQTLRPVQWASSVIAVSSEFNPSPGNFSAIKLLGKPEFYPQCGSNSNCWAPATQNGQREFFVVGFATPQAVNNIRIYQSWGPGAVDTVYVRNASNGAWTTVYQTTAVNQAACPGASQQLLEINLATTGYNVDAVRVAINSPLNTNWNEFDAVSIANFDVMPQNFTQYASEVLRFSSEFSPSPGNFSAARILGAPDASSSCVTDANAWTPLTQSSQREWIEVKYQYPSTINRVTIYQQIAPGAVDTVYLRNASTGAWVKVFEKTAAEETYCIPSKVLEINFTETTYYVDAVRIAINSPVVASYWNEIDAISIQSDMNSVDPTAFLSKQSGNWNDPATWKNGTVPTAADKVLLLSTHTVSLDANGVAKTLEVGSGATLNMNTAGATLTVGDFNAGGGKDSVVVYGNVNIGNGALNIGGRLKQYSIAGNTWVQTGGIVRIDGNTGVAGTSVADADYLLEVNVLLPNTSVGFTYNPTAGTVLFVDPPAGASGRLMYYRTTSANLGNAHTIQYGDGISTTAGGQAQGFINNTFTDVGSVVINNPSGNNRMVTDSRCNGMQSLTVNAGTFNSSVAFVVAGAAANSGSISETGTSIDFRGGVINSGAITISNSFLANGDVTNNAGASITAPQVYFTKNMVNNGTVAASMGFAFARTTSTASTFAQTLSGTGTFNISNAALVLNNSNAGGVTLSVSLSPDRLTLTQGKLFLGANNVTFKSLPVTGGSATAYIVSDGAGRLRFTNLTTSEVLFPIGTASSYNPVRINNGSGHTFSAGVQTGFTTPPPGTQHVNREWDIDDETGGAVSASLTLQWNATDEDASFNRMACVISHYSGGSWRKEGGIGAAGGTNPYTKLALGITSFSPFGVSSNEVILPLQLLDFTALKQANGVQLSWSTAEEKDLSHFEVERSADGGVFERISSQTAANLTGLHHYTVLDNNAPKGLNLYRLKLVNSNGTFSYSGVVRVDLSKSLTVSLLPNPAKGYVLIQSDRQPIRIEITDMNGRLLKGFLPSANGRYNLTGLYPGLYLVRVLTDQEIKIIRLLIE